MKEERGSVMRTTQTLGLGKNFIIWAPIFGLHIFHPRATIKTTLCKGVKWPQIFFRTVPILVNVLATKTN